MCAASVSSSPNAEILGIVNVILLHFFTQTHLIAPLFPFFFFCFFVLFCFVSLLRFHPPLHPPLSSTQRHYTTAAGYHQRTREKSLYFSHQAKVMPRLHYWPALPFALTSSSKGFS
jgi:hypothetical protein